MEHPPDPRYISRDQKCGGGAQRNVPPPTRQGTKFRDILMSDKPNLSYADFHDRLTRDPDDAVSKCLSSQKVPILGVTPKEDELVRYMSNLPSYLEKGNNFSDKALNFGVLDWKRLEKWQYRQKQMSQKHNGCSPSSSSTTVFSTDGSSTHSSRGQSCSPAHQGTHRPSLQSPQESSPKGGNIQDAKSSSSKGHCCSPARHVMHNAVLQSHPLKIYDRGRKSQEIDVFRGNSGKFEGSPVSTVNHLSTQQKVLAAPQQSEREESDGNFFSEMEQYPVFNKNEVAAPWKGKTKILGSESTKQPMKLQETKVKVADQHYFKREKSGLRISPIDQLENRCFAGAASVLAVNDQLSVKAERRSISEKSDFECSVPHKMDNKKHFEPTGSCSQNPESLKDSCHASHISPQSTKMFHSPSRISAQGVKGSSQTPQKLSYPARTLTSPTRSRNADEKLVTGIGCASSGKPSEDFDGRKSSESASKAKNSSPIRRLSFTMGKMIKNASSRDISPLCSSSSRDCVAKSRSEEAIAASSFDNPCSNQSSRNDNRGRSSPLRRLLDPLLKSRASNSSEPSKKHPSPTVGTRKSCNDRSDICAGHSVKIQSRSASACDSHHNSKNESSSLQALLQVSFKNGFPLFTFAIDNESNILAATVRKSFVPGKGHHNWTYTFFTVQEIKRKSGIWLNHGGKGDGPGYVPNVVAQMKVSDSPESPFTKHENADDHITREFDLFAVDVGDGDQYAADFHPTNELAAIIVKLPRIPSEDLSNDGQSSYNWLDLSQAFRGYLQETRSFSGAGYDLQNLDSLSWLNLNTTVVLPGGVHTVPSKGEISTLAQRWRSGGSCDCGGWDLGCQLRVYTNQREYNRTIGSCLDEDKIQLFSQVGQDNELMLSLAPFKDRIYSVEFNSSLSLLQAFAVCISFIDCRRPAELADPSNAVEKINSEIGVFEIPIPMKTANHQVGAPARYISYPPNSPVGRV